MTNPGEMATKLPTGVGWGRFLSTRRNTIAVAGLAALGALGVLLLFMSNYRDSVAGGGAEITVLVADRPLDAGTSGNVIAEADLFRPAKMTEDEAVGGAITDASALRGQVLTEDIAAGEQLTTVAMRAGSDPVAGRLEGTQRALAVPVDAAHGNIGQIREGSRVDVFGGAAAGALARDVLVLGVNDQSGSGASDGKSTVVLRLTDVQASHVALASDQADALGGVWLAVRPPTLAKESKLDADAVSKVLNAISKGVK